MVYIQHFLFFFYNFFYRCYKSGRLDGTAKYYYTSGAVESRIYENGILQGKLLVKFTYSVKAVPFKKN